MIKILFFFNLIASLSITSSLVHAEDNNGHLYFHSSKFSPSVRSTYKGSTLLDKKFLKIEENIFGFNFILNQNQYYSDYTSPSTLKPTLPGLYFMGTGINNGGNLASISLKTRAWILLKLAQKQSNNTVLSSDSFDNLFTKIENTSIRTLNTIPKNCKILIEGVIALCPFSNKSDDFFICILSSSWTHGSTLQKSRWSLTTYLKMSYPSFLPEPIVEQLLFNSKSLLETPSGPLFSRFEFGVNSRVTLGDLTAIEEDFNLRLAGFLNFNTIPDASELPTSSQIKKDLKLLKPLSALLDVTNVPLYLTNEREPREEKTAINTPLDGRYFQVTINRDSYLNGSDEELAWLNIHETLPSLYRKDPDFKWTIQVIWEILLMKLKDKNTFYLWPTP